MKTIREVLYDCQAKGTAVLATNFYNYETLTCVARAAQAMNAPVMLQLTRSSIDYMGLHTAYKMGRQVMEDYGLQGYIHLDHGPSLELVQRCLVSISAKAVEMAKPYGANVEAELGYVAKLGQEQGGGFTTPEQAVEFVNRTGVDALAVSIGSAHGFYKLPPHLDIPRLKAIHAATPVALVLHGSSGIPHDQVREAIANGIVKVNLATEIKDNFMRALKKVLSESDEIDLRKVFPKAMEPVVELLKEKYTVTGATRTN